MGINKVVTFREAHNRVVKKAVEECVFNTLRKSGKIHYSSPKSVYLPDTLKQPETEEDYANLRFIVKTELISKEQAFKMWPEQPEDERTL